MRWLKRALAPLTALLLMAAGAAMPWAVFYVQDRYEEERQEERILDLFSLTLRQETDLRETLGVVQKGDYGISDQAEGAVLTEEEALAAVREALTLMEDCGLAEPWAAEKAAAFQAYSGSLFPMDEDESFSIPMWTIYSEGGDSSYFFYLDDASGKIFHASVPIPGQTRIETVPTPGQQVMDASAGQSAGREDVYIWMDRWRNFMEVYYGVEILEIEEMWYDDGSAEFLLPFYLGEEKELFQMRLYLYCLDGFAILRSG